MPRITPKTKTKSHTRTFKKKITVFEAITFATIVSGIIYFASKQMGGELFQNVHGSAALTTFYKYFTILPMPGDGNCLFHSIAEGLRQQNFAVNYTEIDLKRIAYDDLCVTGWQKWQDVFFAEYNDIPKIQNDDIYDGFRKQFCEDMRISLNNQTQFWGGFQSMTALAFKFNILFKIISIHETTVSWISLDRDIDPTYKGHQTTILLHYANRNHYNLIIPK